MQSCPRGQVPRGDPEPLREPTPPGANGSLAAPDGGNGRERVMTNDGEGGKIESYVQLKTICPFPLSSLWVQD